MRSLLVISIVAVLCVGSAKAIAEPPQEKTAHLNGALDLSCTGNIHAEAIKSWERTTRAYVSEQITDNLNKKGDVYVLYNMQVRLQSFVEMTRRCKDRLQITQLVDALTPVFDSLKPLPDAPATRGWVCTGGSTCTSANHLLGQEVQLCSAQFLGLLGALATNIAETLPEEQRSAAERVFVTNTASTIAAQLDHWLSPDYFKWVEARSKMTPAEAVDGQSKYFFADRDLWFMTSLADLAELHQAGIRLDAAGAKAFKSLQSKRNQIAGMFNLFQARTTLINTSSGKRAEIDRGYWRNYGDSRYALYSTAVSPVTCHKNMFGLMQKSFRVESKASYIDTNLGWDFSHARRLVPALDTLVRNRPNLAAVFGYRAPDFDPAKLQQAFARQIVDKIWNKDMQHPLFTNFWDGSNGWYRAGYDNGTGSCRPGEMPYSLAWSFPTGSYPQWGSFNSTIRSLSQQIYLLIHSSDTESKAFIDKFYPQLQLQSKPGDYRDIWMMVFSSSLVGLASPSAMQLPQK